MPNLVPFLSFVMVATFTPGPNNIMSMTNANRFGFRRTVPFNLGVFGGFILVMLLGSYFNLLLINVLPRIQVWMKLLGAAYMCFLAYKVFRSVSPVVHDGSGRPDSFVSGVLLQFVNPKGVLYAIAVTAGFVLPYYHSVVALVLFALFLGLVAFVSTSCWALFGSLFQKLLSRYQKPFNIAMGLLLVYSAVSLFL